MIRLAISIIAAATLLAACSTTQPPRTEISRASTALGEAEDAGAPSHASAEWSRARRKLEEARQAMDANDYVEARRLAEQAQVDAELAEAKARSQVAVEHARELQQSIETLREETAGGRPPRGEI